MINSELAMMLMPLKVQHEMRHARRRRNQTHALCVEATQPDITVGRCYEIVKITRAGLVFINDAGQRRVYSIGRNRFTPVTAKQARDINAQYDDQLARACFFMMSGEWP